MMSRSRLVLLGTSVFLAAIVAVWFNLSWADEQPAPEPQPTEVEEIQEEPGPEMRRQPERGPDGPPRNERGGRGPGPRRGVFDWFMGPPPPRDGEGPVDRRRFWAENRERMEHIRTERPELAELYSALARVEAGIEVLVERARESWDEPETQEQFEDAVKPLLAEQFDLEMKRQRLELQYMQERIDRIREVLDRKDQLKEQILSRNLNEVIEKGVKREERRSWFRRRGPGGPPNKEG